MKTEIETIGEICERLSDNADFQWYIDEIRKKMLQNVKAMRREDKTDGMLDYGQLKQTQGRIAEDEHWINFVNIKKERLKRERELDNGK